MNEKVSDTVKRIYLGFTKYSQCLTPFLGIFHKISIIILEEVIRLTFDFTVGCVYDNR